MTLPFPPHNPAPNRTAADWAERVRAAAPPGFAGPWPRVSIWQGAGRRHRRPGRTPRARRAVDRRARHRRRRRRRRRLSARRSAPPSPTPTAAPTSSSTPSPASATRRRSTPTAATRPAATPATSSSTPTSARRADRPLLRPRRSAAIGDDHRRRDRGRRDRRLRRRRRPRRSDRRGLGPARRRRPTAGAPGHRNRDLERPLRRAAARPRLPAGRRRHRRTTARPRLRPRRPGGARHPAGERAAGGRHRCGQRRRRLRRRRAAAPPTTSARSPASPASPCGRRRGTGTGAPRRGSFEFQACGLPDGAHPVDVVATDVLGLQATASGPDATVVSRVSARGTWIDHLRDRRLRVYRAPARTSASAPATPRSPRSMTAPAPAVRALPRRRLRRLVCRPRRHSVTSRARRPTRSGPPTSSPKYPSSGPAGRPPRAASIRQAQSSRRRSPM